MFSKQEWKLFGFAVLLTLMSRASAFVSPTFNVDDLWFWAANFDFVTSQTAFREGRFTGPFLYAFQFALGVNAPRAFALSATLLAMCIAASSIIVCRIWRIDGNLIASGLVVALLTQHPYQTDLYTWKMAMLSGGFPFVMTMAAMQIATRGARGFLIAVLIIVLALGVHQIPLELAAGTLALAVPIRLLQKNFIFREWLLMTAALSVATILYVIAAKLTIHYVPHFESVGRDRLIIFSEPLLLVERVCELARVFALADPLTGWLSRALLAGLLIISSAGIFLLKGFSTGRRVGLFLTFVGGVFAAFLCAVSLTVVPVAWMPAYRNLMAINLVWAAIILVAYLLAEKRVKGIVLGASVLILLGFMGMSGEILSDQQRANSRDIVLMNRISADIEKLQNFDKIKLLAFVGTNTAPLKKLRTASDFSVGWYNYGTTLSVFSVWWPGYLVALYNEVNGAAMGWVDEGPAMSQARAYCEGRPSWPAREAVKSMEDWAIICIGPYQKPAPGRLEK